MSRFGPFVPDGKNLANWRIYASHPDVRTMEHEDVLNIRLKPLAVLKFAVIPDICDSGFTYVKNSLNPDEAVFGLQKQQPAIPT